MAVMLHDRRRQWSGLNHYMVPEAIGSLPDGKVGRTAIPGLLRLATMAGCQVGDLDARIFGGASVIGTQLAGASSVLGDIGGRNGELAIAMLAQLGIPVVEKVLGGNCGCRIHLDSASETVQLETMANTQAAARASRVRRPGEKISVLVIDDSDLVRRLIGKVIADSGDLEVIGEAENPFVAREKIMELDPDILCLDLIMPKIDGLTFCGVLCNINRFRPWCCRPLPRSDQRCAPKSWKPVRSTRSIKKICICTAAVAKPPRLYYPPCAVQRVRW